LSQVHITFPCGDITLEGVWHFPEAAMPTPAVIICHPHPLYGGNMSNNVALAICEALARRSIAALRFNFRGAGRSEGTFGNGIAEQEDIRAALSLVPSTANIDPERVGLAGYSFGASVALPVAAQNSEVSLLTLVSPALSDSGWEQLKAYSKPVFIIGGEHDSIIPPEQIQQHIKDTTELKQPNIISGADHFWQGYEMEAAEKAAEFFAAGFKRG